MLSLSRKKSPGGIVGLDVEAGSIAATELRQNGAVELVNAAVEPLGPGAFHEGEVADPDMLVEALKDFFSRHKLAKRVRLGVGNQRVIVRTVRLPAIEDPKEMTAAVNFRAQEQIPMPLDQAVLEHQVVGGVPAEEGQTPQIDVIVVAARREMVGALIEPLRRAGLEPVGVDLSAFGMIRALADTGAVASAAASAVATADADGEQPAQGPADPAPGADGAVLYCNVGDAMNLAVARGRACLFTRVSTIGMASIASRLSGERGLSTEHAAQWLGHVGLEGDLESVEGDPETIAAARRALEEGATNLADELRLSLDYYGAQESAVPVSQIVLAGQGSAIPGLAERMQPSLGLPVSVSRPAALGDYDDGTAARLTLPYGLALES